MQEEVTANRHTEKIHFLIATTHNPKATVQDPTEMEADQVKGTDSGGAARIEIKIIEVIKLMSAINPRQAGVQTDINTLKLKQSISYCKLNHLVFS